jgi:hypothetical protein
MAYHGKGLTSIHEGAAGYDSCAGGGCGDFAPLMSYQDGSLGRTAPLMSYQDGSLGRTAPLMSYQDGSLGYPLFVDGHQVHSPMTIHHGPMGCVSCGMGAVDEEKLGKELLRLLLCLKLPQFDSDKKVTGTIDFGASLVKEIEAVKGSTSAFIANQLPEVTQKAIQNLTAYLASYGLITSERAPTDRELVLQIASYAPCYNAKDYPETSKAIEEATGTKMPVLETAKSVLPWVVGGGIAVIAGYFLLRKK